MSRATPKDPQFFDSPEALRDWFAAHASTETELIVGFRKVGTGRAGLTWPQSVDEALCVGWIDGLRRGIDAEHYQIRFTPRKRGSHWSAINVRRVPELVAAGRMQPAGLAAFEARSENRTARASFEQDRASVSLSREEQALFKTHREAWAFFNACPEGYRHKAQWMVISAKKPETRARRLQQLIEACAQGIRKWD